MSWFTNQALVDELKRQLDTSEKHIRALKSNLERYEKAARDAPVMIDFDRLRIFSIERQSDNSGSYTTIGFWNENKFEQWHLYCNDAHHNELIADYTKWKNSKKSV